jgi:hypothetical protein
MASLLDSPLVFVCDGDRAIASAEAQGKHSSSTEPSGETSETIVRRNRRGCSGLRVVGWSRAGTANPLARIPDPTLDDLPGHVPR